jgi:hypothetical protein
MKEYDWWNSFVVDCPIYADYCRYVSLGEVLGFDYEV